MIIKSLSLLDIKICRDSNELTNFVYRKPTFRRFFTNFKNFIFTVYTLLNRCFNIVSSYRKFHSKRNAQKQIFELTQMQ